MNAEEARQRSLNIQEKDADLELVMINAEIIRATESGRFTIDRKSISELAETALIELGYQVKRPDMFHRDIKIYWGTEDLTKTYVY